MKYVPVSGLQPLLDAFHRNHGARHPLHRHRRRAKFYA